jgi:outer membrane protein OmpA-like peptidoglycan-associated protein
VTSAPVPPPVQAPAPVQEPVVVTAQPPAAAPQALPPLVVPAEPPAAPVMGDIAKAQSGQVPNNAVKSGPLGSQLQIAVIQFGRASSGLGGNDMAVLSKVAQIQKKNGGTVRVVAHAARDVSGTSDADLERGNYEVSKRRALAIANQLMALGVPRSAIVAEAASDGEPIYETNTARGVAANRRAEVYLDF